MLRVRIGDDAPRARYACDLLLSLLGVDWTEAGADGDADLAYGHGQARVCIPRSVPEERWDDPDPALTTSGGLAIVHPAGTAARGVDDAGTIAFDVLYAAYACATAPWERADERNEHGTPRGAAGWLARHGVLQRPLVHEYAAALARAIGLPAPARTPSLVLTHDVDENFGHLFAVRESTTRLVRDLRRGSPAAIRRAAGLARRLGRRGADPNDRWPEWREFARPFGGRSSFFVASYNYFDKGAARYDVGYDVRHPEVVREIRALAEQGAEIGIHFSLQARRSAAQVAREVARLEDATGLAIRSARHHWWALGEQPVETLRAQEAAGIAVDCSFGLSDEPGFRRGLALPFRAYDPAARDSLSIRSLPTIAMDKAVVRPGRTHDQCVDELERLWTTVAGVGGALVLDWHAHCLNPHALAGAGRVLEEFVGRMLDRGVSVRTPLELVDQPAA